MKANILQRMLARNRVYITDLQSHIDTFRELKTESDNFGDLASEYFCHETLKRYRKELANMVVEQKAIKTLIKKV